MKLSEITGDKKFDSKLKSIVGGAKARDDVDKLVASKEWKLYTQHPYGGGLMDIPVRRGELLPVTGGERSGDFVDFIAIDKQGKLVMVMDDDGEVFGMHPEDLDGEIFPAKGKIAKGKDGFMNTSMGGSFYGDDKD